MSWKLLANSANNMDSARHAQGRQDQRTDDVEASDDVMCPRVALAQAFGELQRRQDQRARAGHGMRHQPECDLGVVPPDF